MKLNNISWLVASFSHCIAEQVWQMFEKMRSELIIGCSVVTTHTVHFCYSYSLCIEDVRVICQCCTEKNYCITIMCFYSVYC